MNNRSLLPRIRLAAKPAALELRAPQRAREVWLASAARLAKAAPEEGELAILTEIGFPEFGGTTAAMVKAELDALGARPVTVLLNSPGGDAFEGIAIYNLLREHPAPVRVRVLGLAASAASVIAMAGERIEMAEAAQMMIHSAWGLVVGDKTDMSEFSAWLAQLDEAVAAVYARRSGLAREEVLALMEAETWMTAEDAVERGFADVALGVEDKRKSRPRGARASTQELKVPAALAAAALGARPRVAMHLSGKAPGASGGKTTFNQLPKGQDMKIQEQLASFEAKRAASVARMSELMTLAASEGRTLEEAEAQEHDALAAEVKAIDAHLVRIREQEALLVASATPVDRTKISDPASGSAVRGGAPVITVRPNTAPGIAFARYVKALAMARGNVMQAAQIAKTNRGWRDTTPQVEKALLAAVDAGDTTTSGWASELVYRQNLVDEFIELLRPQTIIGKLTALTPVPFNVRMSGQDSGSSAYWVGQGKPIPVSKLGTMEVTLGIAKAAGLVVLTDELVRSSAPSAELLVRNDLLEAIRTFLDVQFVDPNVAAVANVSPASITNGVTPVTPTGTNAAALRADVQTLFKQWIQNNVDPSTGAWIMETTQALAISLMQNALGQPEFPGITMNGGTFFGLPVITSMSANIPGSPDSGKMIILVNQKDILLADDGGLTVDASREASLEMLDNPTNQSSATATATSMVSMFQTNSVAIKAVRYINWKKRRSTAVQYIKEAQYAA